MPPPEGEATMNRPGSLLNVLDLFAHLFDGHLQFDRGLGGPVVDRF